MTEESNQHDDDVVLLAASKYQRPSFTADELLGDPRVVGLAAWIAEAGDKPQDARERVQRALDRLSDAAFVEAVGPGRVGDGDPIPLGYLITAAGKARVRQDRG